MDTIQVNSRILQWARETAGLTLDDAAKKLQLQQARGISPDQKLNGLEQGIEQPTRSLLLKMSKQYRRPLLVFYLDAPPIKGDRGEDFRRLPEDYTEADDALVDALVRDVRARQSIVRAAIEDENEVTPLPFIGSMTMAQGVERVSTSIRGGISFDLKAFREQRTVTDAFSYLRTRAEAAGIFILIMGDLGSHHTKIPVEVFRGFALADVIAPFVVINDQDAKAAWSFTLLHELTHLWLGQTGISGAIAESALEQFCNDVASTLLLPVAELKTLDISNTTSFETAIELINSFAADRNVSRSMVAYKLLRAGVIGFDVWNSLREEFRRQWLEYQKEQRMRAREQEGGPNYYVVRRYRAGDAVVSLVSRMMASGMLTSTKAGKVLGVKPRNVYELLQLKT